MSFLFLLFLLILPLSGTHCGKEKDSSSSSSSFFNPDPEYLERLRRKGSYGSSTEPTGGGNTPIPTYGLSATIDPSATPFVAPEGNVTINETPLLRTLTAFGQGNDPTTTITLGFSFFTGAPLPKEFRWVVTPPQSNEDTTFTYGEQGTTGTPNNVTSIVSGSLKVDEWSSIRVRGSFSGKFYLRNGAYREIKNGVFFIRRNP